MTCPRCGKELTARQVDEQFDGVCPRCVFKAVVGEDADMAAQTTMLLAPPEGVGRPSGTEFGNYVILGVLGTGGMGIVYRARQKGLERNVALKILPAGKDAPEDLVDRFFREARAAATLKHPNIVPIIEVSNHEGTYFYSMELVEGRTLSNVMKESEVASRELVEILVKVARGVHYAHERNVIHRDLKPSNIMVDPTGEPKILDFGIAKTLGTRSKATETGSAMGTPPYMSPEQVEGAKDIDARGDVYSLGAVLYEILTGRVPYEGVTAMEIFRKLATEEVRPPSNLNPGIDRDLEVICLKALEKRREDRYDSAEALAADLERYLAGEPIMARPLSWSRKAGRFARKRKAWGAIAASLAVMALIVAYTSAPRPNVINPDTPGVDGGKDPEVKRVIERARRTIESVRFGTTPPERLERTVKLDSAIAEVNGMLGAWPGNGELYYWRGRLKEAANRFKEATEDYHLAVERDGTLADARYRRNVCACKVGSVTDTFEGVLEIREENFKTSREDLEALKDLDIAREQVILLEALANHATALKELQEMSSEVDENESVEKQEEESMRVVASLYRPLFDAAEASLRINPTFYDGMVVKFNAERIGEGLSYSLDTELVENIISQQPNDLMGYAARFSTRDNDSGESLSNLAHMIEIDPGNSTLATQYAMWFVNLGLPEIGLNILDEAIRIDPGRISLHGLKVQLMIASASRGGGPVPLKYWWAIKQVLDTALGLPPVATTIPAKGFLAGIHESQCRVLRAYIRHVHLHDEDGARKDFAIYKELMGNKYPAFEQLGFEDLEMLGSVIVDGVKKVCLPEGPGEEIVRKACIDHARFLCRRIELGAEEERYYSLSYLLIRWAVGTGYVLTEEDKTLFQNLQVVTVITVNPPRKPRQEPVMESSPRESGPHILWLNRDKIAQELYKGGDDGEGIDDILAGKVPVLHEFGTPSLPEGTRKHLKALLEDELEQRVVSESRGEHFYEELYSLNYAYQVLGGEKLGPDPVDPGLVRTVLEGLQYNRFSTSRVRGGNSLDLWTKALRMASYDSSLDGRKVKAMLSGYLKNPGDGFGVDRFLVDKVEDLLEGNAWVEEKYRATRDSALKINRPAALLFSQLAGDGARFFDPQLAALDRLPGQEPGTMPGIFTQTGWDGFMNSRITEECQAHVERLALMGYSGRSREDFESVMLSLYVADLKLYWDRFLESIQLKPFGFVSVVKAREFLAQLTNTRKSPLFLLFKRAWVRRVVTIDGVRWNEARTDDGMVDYVAAWWSKTNDAYKPIRNWLGTFRNEHGSSFVRMVSKGGAEIAELEKTFKTAQASLDDADIKVDESLRFIIDDLLVQPIHYTFDLLKQMAGKEMARLWSERVFLPFKGEMKGKYPFTRKLDNADVGAADFADMFGKGGSGFIRVMEYIDILAEVRLLGKPILVPTANYREAKKKALEFSKLLAAGQDGKERISISFRVHFYRANASSILFVVGEHVYQGLTTGTTPELTWTQGMKLGLSAVPTMSGQTKVFFPRAGWGDRMNSPWAFFRFLEGNNQYVSSAKGKFEVVYDLSPKDKLRIGIIASKNVNCLTLDFFTFDCPRKAVE
jgi:tetratricopeptide (TPR) repeat protein